ncbi:hypothetical protein J3R82DRAFT_1012 [Butyriboletus roseoflavus]|nr:hypothetical protein J3R82DRAFT_1012 [Butyriboletus roseoflavus]
MNPVQFSSAGPCPPHHQTNITTEFALSKHLPFGMPFSTENPHDEQGPSNDDSSRSQPPSLPPETYNYLIHALLSLQGSAYPQTYPPTYLYPIHSNPLQNYHSLWPFGTAPPISSSSIAGPPSFYPTNPTIPVPPLAVPQIAGSSQLTPSPAASPTTAPTAQDQEGMEDATYTVEDKRRRNTAASARFRVKKKLKTLDLERTIADLTARTEELEREATDLRRENGWLKEIVLLKGRNFAALNIGLEAPALGNRQDQVDKDDRTRGESEPESTKRRKKGQDEES